MNADGLSSHEIVDCCLLLKNYEDFMFQIFVSVWKCLTERRQPFMLLNIIQWISLMGQKAFFFIY